MRGKNMRCAHFAKICEECGKVLNMRQSHIRVFLTCLTERLFCLSASEDRVTRGKARRFIHAVSVEIAVEMRRRHIDAPVDDVEDDECRREDAPGQPVDVLRRVDQPLGVLQSQTPAVVRRGRRRATRLSGRACLVVVVRRSSFVVFDF